jgi:hypothetical protein
MSKPLKPLDAYPPVEPHEQPPAPPLDPPPAGGEASAPAKAAPPEVAQLAFVGERAKTVPLSCPFELDGQRVDQVIVRRLVTADIASLVRDGRHADLYEIYAAMTGLSAAVLRGLDADDGQQVVEAAWDFLPQSLREAHASS